MGRSSCRTISPRAFVDRLESRTLFTAYVGINPDFGGGSVVMPVVASASGNADWASTGAILTDGRLLTAGLAIQGGYWQTVFALFNRDGTRAASFGKGGVVKQYNGAAGASGVVSLVALPDNTCLVNSGGYLRKLKTDGTFDFTFGTRGILPITPLDIRTQADGTFHVVAATANGFRVQTFDLQGRSAAPASPVVPGRPQVLENGNIVGIGHDQTLTLYTPALTKIETFGYAGVASLQSGVDAWMQSHGPWFYRTPLDTLPVHTIADITPTRDGGYLVDETVYGSRSSASLPDPEITSLKVRISAAGAILSVNSAIDNRTGITFTGSIAGTFGGTFHFGLGQDVALTLPRTRGCVNAAVRAADGSYYLLGATFASADDATSHFTTVHTRPLVGRISGTVFTDANRNQKFDATEGIGVGREVFLDTNKNGKLDPGEASTRTDATGRYTFKDLGRGSYNVRRVLPGGFHFTTPIATIALNIGQSRTYNLGSVGPMTVKPVRNDLFA